MEREVIKQKILNVINKTGGQGITIDDENRDLKEYVKDSMNLLRTLIELEKEFNLKISGEDISQGKIQTLKSTIEHLQAII